MKEIQTELMANCTITDKHVFLPRHINVAAPDLAGGRPGASVYSRHVWGGNVSPKKFQIPPPQKKNLQSIRMHE